MKKRWLYGGLLYSKIFEPLDIAEYYRDKLRNYETQGRPQQYIVLEEWLREDLQQNEERRLERGSGPISYATPKIGLKREERAFIGTQDSLFCAKVEEAIILCDSLKEQDDDQSQIEDQIKFKDFENYVWGLLTRHDVSPEIFLKKSSFMSWWDNYRRATGSSYCSPLYNLMKSGEYIQYEKGD